MTLIGILSYLGYVLIGLEYALPLALIAGLSLAQSGAFVDLQGQPLPW